MRFLKIMVIATAGLMVMDPAFAGEGLDAGARAKVMSTLAKTYKDGKPPAGATVIRGDVVETGCRGVSIGVVKDAKAARNLREQITIVQGDVINAPGRNCRR